MGIKWIDGKHQFVQEDWEWYDDEWHKNPYGPSQSWRTPRDVFDKLHSIFHFTVDACADESNKLLPRFFEDATFDSWEGERSFCNPPFSFVNSFLFQGPRAEVAVFILPVTSLVSSYYAKYSPAWLVIPKQRIQFIGVDGKIVRTHKANLGSVLAVYGRTTNDQIARLEEVGRVWNMLKEGCLAL
jgi:hypothetical protein